MAQESSLGAVIATASLMPANKNPPNQRGLYRAQKIRRRLGGSVSMFEDFPDKPKGMHWRTYDRLRGRDDLADARSMAGLEHFLNSRSTPPPLQEGSCFPKRRGVAPSG